MSGDPGRTLEQWRRVVRALNDPAWAAALPEAEAADLVQAAEGEGVASLLCHHLREAGAEAALPASARERLARRWRADQVRAAVVLVQLTRVLQALAAAGLAPVLLKGAHLVLRHYPSPHLRPMADIDLLFPDLADGERAFAVLQQAGFAGDEPVRGADPWLWSRHLPELHDRRLGITVEIHGGLVFSPRDERHIGERALLAGLEEAAHDGCPVLLMRPEALAVYVLAHDLERHAEVRARLSGLLDVWTVARVEGERFDLAELERLAAASGLGEAVGLGVSLMVEVGLLPPAGPWQRLADRWPPRKGVAAALAPDWQAELTRRELEAARHTRGARGLFRAAVMLLPSPRYMRHRYPGLGRVPLPLLYPYRWWVQARKLAGHLAAVRGRAGRGTRAGRRGGA